MSKRLILALPFLLLPNLALAQSCGCGPGGGSDRDRVLSEALAMQRDGRWERLLAEQQANKLAFDQMKQAEQRGQASPVFTAVAPERPRRGQ